MHRDDSTLLIAMRRGDQSAAAVLWARHASGLLAYATTIVGRADAEDVVQDALVRALTADHAVLGAVEDVPAWLLVLVRRTALNSLRSSRRRRGREGRVAAGPRVYTVTHPADAVAAEVAALPRRLREVVVLRHVCGLTLAQCAAAVGVHISTVAGRSRDAAEMLRASLEVGGARLETRGERGRVHEVANG